MVGLCWALVAASFVFWFAIAGCVGCRWLCCNLRVGFGLWVLFRGVIFVVVCGLWIWLLRFVYGGWFGVCVGFVIFVWSGVV